MDAAQALADLTEISSQIEAAVLFDEGGAVLGSTLADDQAAQALARAGAELLERAGDFRSDGDGVTQLEASTPEGSVFVVGGDPRRIAATTGPAPQTKPANNTLTLTGTLKTGVVAVGAETTGIQITSGTVSYELEIKDADLKKKAEQLSNKTVSVTGTLTVKQGVERRQRLIITVESIAAAPSSICRWRTADLSASWSCYGRSIAAAAGSWSVRRC